jgi:rod shape-determining protein MreC
MRRYTVIEMVIMFVFILLAFGVFFAVITWARRSFPEAYFAFQAPFEGVASTLEKWAGAIMKPQSLIEENDSLHNSNAKLEEQLAAMTVLEQENEFLRTQLSLTISPHSKLLEAQIAGQDIMGSVRTVTIDVGKDNGVKEGDAVLADAAFLIGRVAFVEPKRSQILLVSDPDSRISVTTGRRISGILIGQLSNKLRLDAVPHGQELKEGDMIFSSGIDGLYPPNFPIGKIASITTQETDEYQKALVDPLMDLSQVRRVLVVLNK